MKNKASDSRKKLFGRALQGKKIPILTLDNKWYQLLTHNARVEVSDLESQLNALLKQQGKLNNEVKEIKRLKKKLMEEIVSLMDDTEQNSDNSTKAEQNKELVEECNKRLDSHRDELQELPKQIEELNFQLMTATMESCYGTMHENEKEIEEIANWVAQIRVELKKRLIRKQEMEQHNRTIYSYMHDVFGAEVIDLFDMQYDPEENPPET